MALPRGAAAAAKAITRVINHFVLFLYSYGFSTSGTMVIVASKPRLFDLEMTDKARDRVEGALGLVMSRSLFSTCPFSIVSYVVFEWIEASSALWSSLAVVVPSDC